MAGSFFFIAVSFFVRIVCVCVCTETCSDLPKQLRMLEWLIQAMATFQTHMNDE